MHYWERKKVIMTAYLKMEHTKPTVSSLQREREWERDREESCHCFDGNKHCFGPLCKQCAAAISSDGSSTLSQQFLKRGTV